MSVKRSRSSEAWVTQRITPLSATSGTVASCLSLRYLNNVCHVAGRKRESI